MSSKNKTEIHEITREEILCIFKDTIHDAANSASDRAVEKIKPLLNYDSEFKYKTEKMWYKFWGVITIKNLDIPTWKWFVTMGAICGFIAVIILATGFKF